MIAKSTLQACDGGYIIKQIPLSDTIDGLDIIRIIRLRVLPTETCERPTNQNGVSGISLTVGMTDNTYLIHRSNISITPINRHIGQRTEKGKIHCHRVI